MPTTFRLLPALVATVLPATLAMAQPSACSGPEALGVSREVRIGGPVRLGLKTYPQTLDLQDHEVVLTFDDGPSRQTTPRVLDALDHACVKATFFLIGRNAASAPDLVRREIADGDTVGHHTLSHPVVTLRGLPDAAARAEIERGMEADDKAGYGAYAGQPRVPFFRFPGFADTPALLDRLGDRGIAVFGADLWASDWIAMTPEAELRLLMERLGKAGRGIILLHDIKRQTAEMLPRFLLALKAGGYRVVHIVPGEGLPPTRPAPAGWTSETERTLERRGPTMAHAGALPVPTLRPTQP